MMDLRTLPSGMSPEERCTERRRRIEAELSLSLDSLFIAANGIGRAEEHNCENMFGAVSIPVGCAGPLHLLFDNDEKTIVHLPLATTEAALVASVNRGCKALCDSGGARTNSSLKGVNRSICFKVPDDGVRSSLAFLDSSFAQWKTIGEATSSHLKILSYSLAFEGRHVFLTVSADTDQAMGMNMITIAMQAIGEWIESHIDGSQFITVAANIDSDKKPSVRTRDLGRGRTVTAIATLRPETLSNVLKSDARSMAEVAEAKLIRGSALAGALGANLQAANVVSALYVATGQDIAHTVEGSLASTTVRIEGESLVIETTLPAVLVGVRGGGTVLPAQASCLTMLLSGVTDTHPCDALAQIVGGAVLAGEISLLAAQASHHLARAHKRLR